MSSRSSLYLYEDYKVSYHIYVEELSESKDAHIEIEYGHNRQSYVNYILPKDVAHHLADLFAKLEVIDVS